jgi:hypothetical protein
VFFILSCGGRFLPAIGGDKNRATQFPFFSVTSKNFPGRRIAQHRNVKLFEERKGHRCVPPNYRQTDLPFWAWHVTPCIVLRIL